MDIIDTIDTNDIIEIIAFHHRFSSWQRAIFVGLERHFSASKKLTSIPVLDP